jgi:hypothetical protein
MEVPPYSNNYGRFFFSDRQNYEKKIMGISSSQTGKIM